MKILYLGVISPHNFHEQNTIYTFRAHRYSVCVLNIHRNYFPDKIEGIGKIEICNLYEKGDPYKGKIGRMRQELSYHGFKCYKKVRNKIRLFIEKTQPDLIYCFWGSGVLNEVKMIIEMDLGIPLIHNLLCYPFSLSHNRVRRENRLYSKVINNINLRIYPTNVMLDYVRDRLSLEKGRDLVFMEYFSKNYFYRKRLPLLSYRDKEPHLIFLGRTDFSIQRPIDDVRKQILELASERIHIHLREPATDLPKNEYIHPFPVFDSSRTFQGELATFSTQFDACIVLYNLPKNICTDRFRNTLPSRFLFALTAGIPIVMPGNTFIASEEIVKRYNIGFTYENVDSLRERLFDRRRMENLRENAIRRSKDFTYEANFCLIEGVIKSLL